MDEEVQFNNDVQEEDTQNECKKQGKKQTDISTDIPEPKRIKKKRKNSNAQIKTVTEDMDSGLQEPVYEKSENEEEEADVQSENNECHEDAQDTDPENYSSDENSNLTTSYSGNASNAEDSNVVEGEDHHYHQDDVLNFPEDQAVDFSHAFPSNESQRDLHGHRTPNPVILSDVLNSSGNLLGFENSKSRPEISDGEQHSSITTQGINSVVNVSEINEDSGTVTLNLSANMTGGHVYGSLSSDLRINDATSMKSSLDRDSVPGIEIETDDMNAVNSQPQIEHNEDDKSSTSQTSVGSSTVQFQDTDNINSACATKNKSIKNLNQTLVNNSPVQSKVQPSSFSTRKLRSRVVNQKLNGTSKSKVRRRKQSTRKNLPAEVKIGEDCHSLPGVLDVGNASSTNHVHFTCMKRLRSQSVSPSPNIGIKEPFLFIDPEDYALQDNSTSKQTNFNTNVTSEHHNTEDKPTTSAADQNTSQEPLLMLSDEVAHPSGPGQFSLAPLINSMHTNDSYLENNCSSDPDVVKIQLYQDDENQMAVNTITASENTEQIELGPLLMRPLVSKESNVDASNSRDNIFPTAGSSEKYSEFDKNNPNEKPDLSCFTEKILTNNSKFPADVETDVKSTDADSNKGDSSLNLSCFSAKITSISNENDSELTVHNEESSSMEYDCDGKATKLDIAEGDKPTNASAVEPINQSLANTLDIDSESCSRDTDTFKSRKRVKVRGRHSRKPSSGKTVYGHQTDAVSDENSNLSNLQDPGGALNNSSSEQQNSSLAATTVKAELPLTSTQASDGSQNLINVSLGNDDIDAVNLITTDIETDIIEHPVSQSSCDLIKLHEHNTSVMKWNRRIADYSRRIEEQESLPDPEDPIAKLEKSTNIKRWADKKDIYKRKLDNYLFSSNNSPAKKLPKKSGSEEEKNRVNSAAGFSAKPSTSNTKPNCNNDLSTYIVNDQLAEVVRLKEAKEERDVAENDSNALPERENVSESSSAKKEIETSSIQKESSVKHSSRSKKSCSASTSQTNKDSDDDDVILDESLSSFSSRKSRRERDSRFLRIKRLPKFFRRKRGSGEADVVDLTFDVDSDGDTDDVEVLQHDKPVVYLKTESRRKRRRLRSQTAELGSTCSDAPTIDITATEVHDPPQPLDFNDPNLFFGTLLEQPDRFILPPETDDTSGVPADDSTDNYNASVSSSIITGARNSSGPDLLAAAGRTDYSQNESSASAVAEDADNNIHGANCTWPTVSTSYRNEGVSNVTLNNSLQDSSSSSTSHRRHVPSFLSELNVPTCTSAQLIEMYHGSSSNTSSQVPKIGQPSGSVPTSPRHDFGGEPSSSSAGRRVPHSGSKAEKMEEIWQFLDMIPDDIAQCRSRVAASESALPSTSSSLSSHLLLHSNRPASPPSPYTKPPPPECCPDYDSLHDNRPGTATLPTTTTQTDDGRPTTSTSSIGNTIFVPQTVTISRVAAGPTSFAAANSSSNYGAGSGSGGSHAAAVSSTSSQVNNGNYTEAAFSSSAVDVAQASRFPDMDAVSPVRRSARSLRTPQHYYGDAGKDNPFLTHRVRIDFNNSANSEQSQNPRDASSSRRNRERNVDEHPDFGNGNSSNSWDSYSGQGFRTPGLSLELSQISRAPDSQQTPSTSDSSHTTTIPKLTLVRRSRQWESSPSLPSTSSSNRFDPMNLPAGPSRASTSNNNHGYPPTTTAHLIDNIRTFLHNTTTTHRNLDHSSYAARVYDADTIRKAVVNRAPIVSIIERPPRDNRELDHYSSAYNNSNMTFTLTGVSTSTVNIYDPNLIRRCTRNLAAHSGYQNLNVVDNDEYNNVPANETVHVEDDERVPQVTMYSVTQSNKRKAPYILNPNAAVSSSQYNYQPNASNAPVSEVKTKSIVNEPVPSCSSISSQAASSSNEISCPICLDSLAEIKATAKGVFSTICGHLFCAECLEAAVLRNKQCPTCRRKLTKKQYHKVFI